jgi:hypothetical protein
MAPIADRVKQTTTTTGTGAVALTGSCVGYQDFATAFADGTTVYYGLTDGTNWEVGVGTFTAGSPGALSRDTVLSSSAGGAKVNFGTGTKEVFVTVPASRIPVLAPDGSSTIPDELYSVMVSFLG